MALGCPSCPTRTSASIDVRAASATMSSPYSGSTPIGSSSRTTEPLSISGSPTALGSRENSQLLGGSRFATARGGGWRIAGRRRAGSRGGAAVPRAPVSGRPASVSAGFRCRLGICGGAGSPSPAGRVPRMPAQMPKTTTAAVASAYAERRPRTAACCETRGISADAAGDSAASKRSSAEAGGIQVCASAASACKPAVNRCCRVNSVAQAAQLSMCAATLRRAASATGTPRAISNEISLDQPQLMPCTSCASPPRDCLSPAVRLERPQACAA